MANDIKLFCGTANPELAKSISNYLKVPMGKAEVNKFSDGEIKVEIKENVRGQDIFIVQSICNPTNDNLMEIIFLVDALKRAAANNITAIIPYFGYTRQDKKVRSARVPISAKVLANMLTNAGINHVVTVDLHADQIQGFFSIPVDNIYTTPVMMADAKQHFKGNITVVSPDIGGVVRARAARKALEGAELAIIDKIRPKPNESKVMNIIGDVAGRTCIIVDDIVDTAGTLCNAAAALKEQGAKQVIAYIVHPVLSGPAIDRINQAELDELVVTNTIKLKQKAKECGKIRQIDLSEWLSEALRRIIVHESLSSMFI